MAEADKSPSLKSLAEAAKLVKISPKEALSHKDYGTHVVVVTVDGQKLSSADKPADKVDDKA